MQHLRAPERIKDWVITKPDWLEVRNVRISPSHRLENLDYGERKAIFLAEERKPNSAANRRPPSTGQSGTAPLLPSTRNKDKNTATISLIN